MNGFQIDAVHNAFAEKDAEIERLTADSAELRGKIEALRIKILRDTAEIERLTAEVEEWKERWAAERRDQRCR